MTDTGIYMAGPFLFSRDGNTGYYIFNSDVCGPNGPSGYRVRDSGVLDADGKSTGFRFSGDYLFGPSARPPWHSHPQLPD